MKTIHATTFIYLFLLTLSSSAFVGRGFYNYHLLINGLQIGEETRELLQLKDGSYRYNANAKTTGVISLFKDYEINATSDFRIGENGTDAYYYQRREISHGNIEKDIEITIDSANQIVTSKEGKRWQTKPGPVVDELSLFLALANDLKTHPEKSDFYYQVANGKKIAQQHFKKAPKPEVVSLDGGEFNAVRMDKQFNHKDRQVSVWLAADYFYLPILIIQTESDGEEYQYRLIDEQGTVAQKALQYD